MPPDSTSDVILKNLLRKLDDALSDAQRLSEQVTRGLKDAQNTGQPAREIERRKTPRPT